MLDGYVGATEAETDRYRAAGYWTDGSLGDVLDGAPQGVALVCDHRRWTYAELDSWVERVASGLEALGLAADERVVVHLPNVAEFAAVCLALFRIGAVPVLALPAHRDAEIAHLCRLSGARAYVVIDDLDGTDGRALARRVRSEVPSVEHVVVVGDAAEFQSLAGIERPPAPGRVCPDPADVAVLLISGGTTGLPKLIPRTHQDYCYNVRASAELCGLSARTVYLAALPAAHNFALACPGVLGTWQAGGTVVLARSGSPDEAFYLIERERVTITALVPPLALMWLDTVDLFAPDLSSLGLLQVGGARLAPGPARQVGPVLGCRLQQVFGMAEGLLNFTRHDDPPELVEGTQGRPLSPDDEVRVVDAAGDHVPDGETGRLLTRGPYTIRGYYCDASANATAFTPDGWYCSGDLVRRLPSGHLVVEGRVTDVINRGGEKVPVEQVEDVLHEHPQVREVALIGVPDPTMGEVSCACVVPYGDAPDRDELAAFLRARGVSTAAVLDRLRILTALPRTAVGKIDRRRLVDAVTAGTDPGPAVDAAQ